MNALSLNSQNIDINASNLQVNASSLRKIQEATRLEAIKAANEKLVNLAKNKILDDINSTIAHSRITNTSTGELGASFDRYAYMSESGEVLSGLYDEPTFYEISSGKNAHRYFEQIGASEFYNSPYRGASVISADTKIRNINEYGLSDTLKTAYGDVKVFFDPYGDNDKFGFGKIDANV